MSLPRHPILAVALMAALALSACHKAVSPVTADEMSLGDPKAKVTVVEYASVACPFCARFNNEVFPGFKAKYVDTGKVRYVFREMLVGDANEASMGAAGFLLARCAGKDDYFKVVDQIFHAQEGIYRSGDLRGGLLAIAKANGMSDRQFSDCVGNADALAAINARSDKAAKDGIDSTPSFVVNGKKIFDGVPTEAQLEAAVQAAS